jgi:hypothetical protein
MVMSRHLAFIIACSASLTLLSPFSLAAQYGTAEEAKAMLKKAVVAVEEYKLKALDMLNKSEGGFSDCDLYVFCANAVDGALTAHPTMKGEHLQDVKGKKGFPLGQEMMKKATEGKGNLLVAAPRHRYAIREDLFLHESWRSGLLGRLLQGMNANRALMPLTDGPLGMLVHRRLVSPRGRRRWPLESHPAADIRYFAVA